MKEKTPCTQGVPRIPLFKFQMDLEHIHHQKMIFCYKTQQKYFTIFGSTLGFLCITFLVAMEESKNSHFAFEWPN